MTTLNGNYRGQRALMLLRVSTPKQEEMFGFASQERQIRENLINPLGLQLDELRHIIKDTYTGLEFRDRKALHDILAMANNKEFDVLVMDVLDRGLGRKALAREIYRMQLRELGIHVLTTNPDDHADDDSLIGEMIRLMRGYVAEEELNNIRRRTMNGKRERVEEGKLLGAPTPAYGYTYPLTNVGMLDRTRYILNDIVIRVDQYGVSWTEVTVVIFIFEEIANGRTMHDVAKELIERGIPTRKGKDWCISTIAHILHNSYYVGKAYMYKERLLEERVPGKQRKKREKRDVSEMILMPEGVVPAIVSDEIFAKVQKILVRNKQLATRNSKHPETLLRAGLAKCGYCGSNLTVHWVNDHPDRHEKAYSSYYCSQARNHVKNPCHHHAILTETLDDVAWQAALEIIANPTLVDAKVAEKRTPDPTTGSRKQINRKIAELKREQAAARDYLNKRIRARTLDKGTEEYLEAQLRETAEKIEKYERQNEEEEEVHERWKKVEQKLDELHQFCAEMRENLNDPEYVVDMKRKRDVLEFFGITVLLWGKDHKPRYIAEYRPPSIVSTLS